MAASIFGLRKGICIHTKAGEYVNGTPASPEIKAALAEMGYKFGSDRDAPKPNEKPSDKAKNEKADSDVE